MSLREKCSHDDNRRKVCAPCGRKIVFGQNAPSRYFIDDAIEALIVEFVNEDYDINNEKFPTGICRTCCQTLKEAKKKIFQRPMPKMPLYQEIILPKNTRSRQDICNCFVCLTGRDTRHVKIMRGRGKKRKFDIIIDSPKGKRGNSEVTSLPTITRPEIKNTKKICNKCMAEIGRGKIHNCGNAVGNLELMVKQLPEKQQNQVASGIIYRKKELENCPDRHIQNVEVPLSTKGRKLNIVVNPTKKPEVKFTEEKLDNFRANFGASANEMKQITNLIRSTTGKKSIPAHYREHVSEQSKLMEHLYHVETCEFVCDDAGKLKTRPVVYGNAEEILDFVVDKRGVIGYYATQVMADGGQIFFKICLTIRPENDLENDIVESQNESSDDNICYDDLNSQKVKRKRISYADGGSMAKKAKVSSVKRVILLCIVPDIKETYENIQKLLDLTKLNDIPFKFVSDFKMLLIINGQQIASAMYPCPYCFVALHELRNKEVVELEQPNTSTACSSSTVESISGNSKRLKTYGDLRKDYDKFCSTGKKKKYAKECHSTINPPLFTEDDDHEVLKKCIIPELHIVLGFANHLFWNGLVPILGEEKALLWPKSLNIIYKGYHGRCFEGNGCRKLIKEVDKLQEILSEAEIFKVMPIIAAFKAMDKVVNSCFTAGKVDTSWSSYMEELRKSLDAVKHIGDVSETLKLHVLTDHVGECLKFIKNNYGLGYWSEQCGESIHRAFLKIWNKYKINDITHKSYPNHLLAAVIEFSSLNI